jgi:AcrR family transcriptional regulator
VQEPRRYRPSRRNIVLGAALTEIVNNGYAETTLAEVAARAKVTVTAVYYHFDSKLALLQELVGPIGEEMLAALPADLAQQRTIGEATVAIFDAFYGWLGEHEEEARLFFVRASGVSPEVEGLRRSWTTRVATTASQHVQRVRPHLDLLTARVVGLAVPTMLEEYAILHLEGRIARSGRREVRAAVRHLGERLDMLSDRPDPGLSDPDVG